jgi:NAD(P)-dependent dehydrogenase (short-subunit alcohol dehydrogenase family)
MTASMMLWETTHAMCCVVLLSAASCRVVLCCAMQRVRSSCPRPSDVVVLPFDLLGSSEALQAAAKAADGTFGAAGVDFLIHNAGE